MRNILYLLCHSNSGKKPPCTHSTPYPVRPSARGAEEPDDVLWTEISDTINRKMGSWLN